MLRKVIGIGLMLSGIVASCVSIKYTHDYIESKKDIQKSIIAGKRFRRRSKKLNEMFIDNKINWKQWTIGNKKLFREYYEA